MKLITKTKPELSEGWFINPKGFLTHESIPNKRITGLKNYNKLTDDIDVITNYVGR